MYQRKEYGRDGDERHALNEPGGSGKQRDVLHLVNINVWRVHPTRFDPAYVGLHRA